MLYFRYSVSDSTRQGRCRLDAFQIRYLHGVLLACITASGLRKDTTCRVGRNTAIGLEYIGGSVLLRKPHGGPCDDCSPRVYERLYVHSGALTHLHEVFVVLCSVEIRPSSDSECSRVGGEQSSASKRSRCQIIGYDFRRCSCFAANRRK